MKNSQTSSTTPVKLADVQLASGWDRLTAFLLDGVILGVPSALVFIWLLSTTEVGAFFVVSIQAVILLLTLSWLNLLYIVGLRAKFQKTLGMYCVGLAVTKVNGETLTWKEIGFRELIGKMASHYLLGWGFLGAWRHPQKQTWHDRLVDSIVIQSETRPAGVKVYLLLAALLLQGALWYFLIRLVLVSPLVLGLFDMLSLWLKTS